MSFISTSGCRLIFGRSSADKNNYVQRAEDALHDGEPDKAIEFYEKHMQYRLSLKKRPDWENPFIYLLAIGDILLTQNKISDALAKYEEAEKHSVDARLISDRYRQVAEHYENGNDLTRALEVLQKYRDRDPLLFDGMLDRIAKREVRGEELEAVGSPAH